MFYLNRISLSIFLTFLITGLSCQNSILLSQSSNSAASVVISQNNAKLDIGDEVGLTAVTSTGKAAKWKSNNSKIASVNKYGVVTAKKAGTALITAYITNAEASCQITVNKTDITISQTDASIERGEILKLTAAASSHSVITWKSSKKSVAVIDEFGTITGLKPGETIITAKADGYSTSCRLIVKSPSVKLDKSTLYLYRGQTAKLTATVSSKVNPVWKTNKKSVVLVDEAGNITAIKNGTATISATVDGISETCEVIVLKPEIKINLSELYLKKGDSTVLTAIVSSGNKPLWSSSNDDIVSVTPSGKITALQKGTAYIYVSEDGTKKRCKVHVTD